MSRLAAAIAELRAALLEIGDVCVRVDSHRGRARVDVYADTDDQMCAIARDLGLRAEPRLARGESHQWLHVDSTDSILPAVSVVGPLTERAP